jgi:3-methyladenine DNA glycosylase/8-oxoguanine DNA glycosylase
MNDEEMMNLTLPLPPHYRFEAMIDAHGWPQLAPFSWDRTRRLLGRVERLQSGNVVRLEIGARDSLLAVAVEGPDLDRDEREEVERTVRWMVELDEEFEEFYAFCASEPALAHIPVRGLGPMLRSPTVWEDYVKTVCTTNTTWAQTKGMVARIVAGFGAPFAADGPHAFPTPETIAAVDLETFATAARAGYRAPYLHQTALDIAEGRLDLEHYKQQARAVETRTLMKELQRLRGIGPYAAAHLALLLGSYGYIPVDSWARDLVRRHFRQGEQVTDREVHAYFAHYGRWQALAFRCWDWQ